MFQCFGLKKKRLKKKRVEKEEVEECRERSAIRADIRN
jgi:hypothetical protein